MICVSPLHITYVNVNALLDVCCLLLVEALKWRIASSIDKPIILGSSGFIKTKWGRFNSDIYASVSVNIPCFSGISFGHPRLYKY